MCVAVSQTGQVRCGRRAPVRGCAQFHGNIAAWVPLAWEPRSEGDNGSLEHQKAAYSTCPPPRAFKILQRVGFSSRDPRTG